GFLPLKYSANVVGMAMRQNDVLHMAVAFGSQESLSIRGVTCRGSIYNYISVWRGHQIHVAGRWGHIDGVADLYCCGLILADGIQTHADPYKQQKRKDSDSRRHSLSPDRLYLNLPAVKRPWSQ